MSAVTQIERPAGAGHETLAVLAGCALIVAVAGTVVTLRAASMRAACSAIATRRSANWLAAGISRRVAASIAATACADRLPDWQ